MPSDLPLPDGWNSSPLKFGEKLQAVHDAVEAAPEFETAVAELRLARAVVEAAKDRQRRASATMSALWDREAARLFGPPSGPIDEAVMDTGRDECATKFKAPDIPGGGDETHTCDRTGAHSTHHCVCGAISRSADG